MSLVDTEHVLVVPTELLHRLGHFQGFCGDTQRYLDELLSPEHTSYRPRREMEQDPSFKQLIPYVVFCYQTPEGELQLFQDQRGKGQGEKRLHSKRSIGIGGHISSDDAVAESELHPYDEGMQRELAEEVRVGTTYRSRCAGLINDDQTEVGRVHLGVVHLLDVDEPAVEPNEPDIVDAGFRPVAELLEGIEQFETWSQICLRAVFGDN